jgi:hypothetical protein
MHHASRLSYVKTDKSDFAEWLSVSATTIVDVGVHAACNALEEDGRVVQDDGRVVDENGIALE